MGKNKKEQKEIHKASKDENSEEIEFDFSKIKKIFTNPALVVILLLIIPMFLAGYFRMYPANLPIAERWADSSIQNNIRYQIGNQVNQQYPNLPDTQKQQIIDEQTKDYISKNQDAYNQAIVQNADAIREQFRDETGTNYLSDIDTWSYYRYVRNMVEKGHAYDELRDGIAYDTHKYAPLGSEFTTKFLGADFHTWVGFLNHKFITTFDKNESVMGTFFYVSIIVSVLSVIPAFFLARKIGGNVGGFFAAAIIAVHPAFLGRTVGGVVDTDAYGVFFPLLISWFFIEAFEKENMKIKIFWGSLAGFAVGIYSFAWGGYWYIFDFIIAAMIGYIIYYIILHRNDLKKGSLILKNKNISDAIILLLVLLVTSGIFVSFFLSFETYKSGFLEPISRLSIKSATGSSLWPNVYTTVAELNEASVSQVIGQIGGTLLFVIALIGIMFTMSTNKTRDLWVLLASAVWFLMITTYQDKLSLYLFLVLLSLPIIVALLIPLITKEEGIDIKYAIFMTLWFMGTIFTATKGVRFVLLLVPVFGVAFGIAIGKFYRLVVDWFVKELEINKIVTKVIVILLLLLLLINPVKSSHNTAINEVPMMNDGWYQSLEKIRNEAAPDAIVNSWWDFGHWFKAIADRAVTFDGGSQNTPMAHWIGNTLLTSDEDRSVGILRMLDCGSNNAFEELNKEVNDVHKSVNLLYELVVLDKKSAQKTLEENDISEKTVKNVIKYTHCSPPEDYFITSEDMVGKSGVWAHFGSWDFKRAEIWQEYRSLSFDEFVKKATTDLGYDEKTAKDMYYQIQTITDERTANTWIAPWPSYMSGKTPCTVSEVDIRCQNGLIINKTDYEAWIPTKEGDLHPKTLVYIVNGTLMTKDYDKGKVLTSGDGTFIGAALMQNGDTYYTILMDDRLSQSLFTKLFFLEGAGTKHFERFSDMRTVTGERIIIWKVKWE